MNFYAVKLTKGLEKDGEKSKFNLLIPLITSPLAEAVSVISNNYIIIQLTFLLTP